MKPDRQPEGEDDLGCLGPSADLSLGLVMVEANLGLLMGGANLVHSVAPPMHTQAHHRQPKSVDCFVVLSK